MSITPELLRQQIEYTAWASARLVEAAARLAADELDRDFGTADRSILGTLVHVFAADRVWIGRINGDVPAQFLDVEKDRHLHVLQSEWPQVLSQWRQLGATITETGLLKQISYKNLKGASLVTPLWQIVLHVVNHGTHHRGQAAGFLRSMGQTPPPLDLVAYYRSSPVRDQ